MSSSAISCFRADGCFHNIVLRNLGVRSNRDPSLEIYIAIPMLRPGPRRERAFNPSIAACHEPAPGPQVADGADLELHWVSLQDGKLRLY